MRAQFYQSIAEIPDVAWNALVPPGHPFLRHEFLYAMEQFGCVGRHYGWLPYHLAIWQGESVVGAVPLYIKTNSYGEFVFDWSWADAYARQGLRYYPKLVSAIPYTPATGSRLLAHDPAVRAALIEQVHKELTRMQLSSMHWLFPLEHECVAMCEQGALAREDVQFHWRNAGYRDFADFLATLTAKKRKNIQRERRLVRESGVYIERILGQQASAEQWRAFHEFYCHTFDTKGGMPTFSLEFFQHLGRVLGDQILLVMARDGGRYVAGALCYIGGDTLFGRHWGAHAQIDSLHFELCYYQGIEFAIERGLAVFEPGAQGEHKIARGFLPVVTRSAHMLTHPVMGDAIARYLAQERAANQEYVTQCLAHSPYRVTY